MTTDKVNLRDHVGKTRDADLLHKMIGLAAEGEMDLEVGAATGVGPSATASPRSAHPSPRPRDKSFGEGKLWP